jgi:chromosome segregation ATPase
MEKSLMNYLKIFIIISFLMFSVSSAAEFYKYVDEEGNIHFTDDINEVPAAQRAKIHSYIESVSEAPPEQEATQENQAEQTESEQQASVLDIVDDEEESLEDAKKRIDALKEELDQEYEALKKERNQLAEERQQAKTNQQILKYNKKVDRLNKRAKTYEKKGNDYEARGAAYRARVNKKNSNDPNE